MGLKGPAFLPGGGQTIDTAEACCAACTFLNVISDVIYTLSKTELTGIYHISELHSST